MSKENEKMVQLLFAHFTVIYGAAIEKPSHSLRTLYSEWHDYCLSEGDSIDFAEASIALLEMAGLA